MSDSESEEIDPQILELLLREHNKKRTNSFASGSRNGGKLTNIKLAVNVQKKQEILRQRFSGDDHVSDIAQAIIDQTLREQQSIHLYYCGKVLKMDQLVSSLEGIKGD